MTSSFVPDGPTDATTIRRSLSEPRAFTIVFDRHFGTSFFLPAQLVLNNVPLVSAAGAPLHQGGSPLLWQHLFWFLGHPEVYILMLPALGFTSDIIAVFARRPIFGHKTMVGALLVIAFAIIAMAGGAATWLRGVARESAA